MNNNAQKGWKPFVLKIAIIGMSICYVFGSSHSEVNKLLHVILHQLEMPNNVMSHTTTMHSNYKMHVTHSLNKPERDHNHKLLRFLDTVLKASDSKKNQENSNVLSIKIDKHLTARNSYKYYESTVSIPVQHVFLFTEQKLQKGFGKDTIEPPQVV